MIGLPLGSYIFIVLFTFCILFNSLIFVERNLLKKVFWLNWGLHSVTLLFSFISCAQSGMNGQEGKKNMLFTLCLIFNSWCLYPVGDLSFSFLSCARSGLNGQDGREYISIREPWPIFSQLGAGKVSLTWEIVVRVKLLTLVQGCLHDLYSDTRFKLKGIFWDK